MALVEMSGKRFGRLLVLSREPNDKHGFAAWKAVCDCGNTITALGISLRSGSIQSCKCLQKERAAVERLKHGHAVRGHNSREYNSWQNMKNRCLRPTGHHVKDYGERGISICERWMNSFEDFLADMGPRPPGTTLERKNNDGNYEPGNCRWATPKEQAKNRREKTFRGSRTLAV